MTNEQGTINPCIQTSEPINLERTLLLDHKFCLFWHFHVVFHLFPIREEAQINYFCLVGLVFSTFIQIMATAEV